eukprot:330969-Chlamydomonas_euryale.AAC.1
MYCWQRTQPPDQPRSIDAQQHSTTATSSAASTRLAAQRPCDQQRGINATSSAASTRPAAQHRRDQ